MSTFGQIQDRINNDILNRTDLTAETVRAVQAAVRHYERRRFWFNETSAGFLLTAATRVMTFPVNFLVLDRLEVIQSSVPYQLVQKSFEFGRDLNPNTTGLPTTFFFYQNQAQVWPIPNINYSVNAFGVLQFAVLSATADTNDWTSAAEDLIVYHASKHMWANILRNTEEAVKFAELERQSLSMLEQHTEEKVMHAIRATRF